MNLHPLKQMTLQSKKLVIIIRGQY